MTDETTKESSSFAVVVLGRMNPGIHHPYWYKSVNLFSDEEEKAALEKDFVILPQLAQFKTGPFQFFCDLQRWQLTTVDVAQSERVLEITRLLFDQYLPHTPVSAMGLNFYMHRLTPLANVGKYLANQLTRLDLKLPGNEGCSGAVVHTCPIEHGQLRMRIEPSARGEELVYFNFNAHIPFKSKERAQAFQLGPFAVETYATVRPVVDRRVKAILEEMRKAGEG